MPGTSPPRAVHVAGMRSGRAVVNLALGVAPGLFPFTPLKVQHAAAVLPFPPVATKTSIMGVWVLLAQAFALLQTAMGAVWNVTFYMPIALVTVALRKILPGCDGQCDGSARFYEVRAA